MSQGGESEAFDAADTSGTIGMETSAPDDTCETNGRAEMKTVDTGETNDTADTTEMKTSAKVDTGETNETTEGIPTKEGDKKKEVGGAKNEMGGAKSIYFDTDEKGKKQVPKKPPMRMTRVSFKNNVCL